MCLLRSISSFLSQVTGRVIHKIIYKRLYAWIGTNVQILTGDSVPKTESEWTDVLSHLPYTLRWVHKDYNFYFDAYKPECVAVNDARIEYTWSSHANIVIEWRDENVNDMRLLLNKIGFRNDTLKRCVHDLDVMDLYQCLDRFMSDKKLWALPEVCVLHLPRFYKFRVERLNKSIERNGYIPSM